MWTNVRVPPVKTVENVSICLAALDVTVNRDLQANFVTKVTISSAFCKLSVLVLVSFDVVRSIFK